MPTVPASRGTVLRLWARHSIASSILAQPETRDAVDVWLIEVQGRERLAKQLTLLNTSSWVRPELWNEKSGRGEGWEPGGKDTQGSGAIYIHTYHIDSMVSCSHETRVPEVWQGVSTNQCHEHAASCASCDDPERPGPQWTLLYSPTSRQLQLVQKSRMRAFCAATIMFGTVSFSTGSPPLWGF
jgi:hypothetical protein